MMVFFSWSQMAAIDSSHFLLSLYSSRDNYNSLQSILYIYIIYTYNFDTQYIILF